MKKEKSADTLEGQLVLKDMSKKSKPMKNVLSNLFSKFTN